MSKKWQDINHFVLTIAAVVLACILVGFFNFRIDLTGDKRYTLSNQTKSLLRDMDDVVLIRVYLEGDMPVTMRKLQRSVSDMLDDMRSYAKGNLQFEFIDPSQSRGHRSKETIHRELFSMGLQPFIIQENNSKGGVTQMELFPGAIVSLGEKQYAVNFLQTNQAISTEENINNATQSLEYSLINAVDVVTRKEYKKVAFIEGHDELNASQVADITRELMQYYRVNRLTLNGEVDVLNDYDVAVVAKPRKTWSEADKLVMDQFIMRGGKVAWFIDAVNVHEDSLANGSLTFGLVNEHGLDDMLFQYGVRLNANVVQDLQCARIPVNVSPVGMPPRFSPLPWTYYPLLTASGEAPITRNINPVKAEFPGSVDTLNVRNVQKQLLLTSSQHALVKSAPFSVSLEQVTENINPRTYNQKFIPVAVLLSGEFTSIFQNRPLRRYNNGKTFDFIPQSAIPTQQVVVADGDIIRNDVLANGNAFPLGYDRFTKQILYGNKDFVRNIISYLTDDSGLMELRNRVVTLRLLDRVRVVRQRTMWIVINTVAPLALLAVGGLTFIYLRKRKYGRKLDE